MEKITQPSFFLEYNSADITEDISSDLIELSYTDAVHGKSDSLEIKINNVHRLWSGEWLPFIGDTLTCQIGYEDGYYIDCGEFSIDELDFSGGGGAEICTIKGLSASITKEIRTTRTQAYENIRLSQIAQEVAARHNLIPVTEMSRDPYFDRVTQNNEKDLAFLKRLADGYGYAFSVRGGKLFYYAQEKLNAEKTYFVIRRSDITSYSFNKETTKLYKTIIVRYRLPNSAEVGHYFYTDETLRHGELFVPEEIVDSLSQAEQMAQSMLRDVNMQAVKASFTLPGNPRLIAGINVQLDGFDHFDTKMQIVESKHQLSRRGYTTQIELKAVGES